MQSMLKGFNNTLNLAAVRRGIQLVLAIGIAVGFVSQVNAAAVYVEDSPQAQEQGEQALELIAKQQHGEAARLLQGIIEDYAGKLLELEPGRYTDAPQWAEQVLIEHPDTLEAYRTRYAFEAQREMEAVQSASLRAEQWQPVLHRYRWTPAGLEAWLAMASLSLEKGDAGSAASQLQRIDQHPEADAKRLRIAQLQAAAAVLQHNETQFQAAREAIDGLTAESEQKQTLAKLDAFATSWSAASENNANVESPSLERPLWRVELGLDTIQGRSLTKGSSGTDPLMMRPAVSEDSILLTDADRVISVDRISGRLQWLYQPDSAEPVDPMVSRFIRQVTEEREVAIDGRQAFAVLGFPTGVTIRRAVELPTTRIVCLNLDTGKELWIADPAGLGEGLDKAAFHGTPIAIGQAVIVMARRSQTAGFQDSYLVALDRDSGQVLWRRHLASTSGPLGRGQSVALSKIVLHDDRLYFTDNLGVAASLDPRSGAVHWLTVLLDNQQEVEDRLTATGSPASDLAEPLLCEAGLIIPIKVGDRHGLLLDPETGIIRNELSERLRLDRVSYLMTHEGDVLTVGRGVARLSGETLDMKWKVNPGSGDRVIRHRLALLEDRMWVSTQQGIQAIDTDAGRLLARHDAPVAGHLVIAGDTLVAADGQALAVYLRWPKALEQLIARHDADPYDIDPGLNLAHIAAGAGADEAALRGVDMAIAAMSATGVAELNTADSAGDLRSRVFDELLLIAEQPQALQTETVRTLLDRLSIASRTPGEITALSLAEGRYHESGSDLQLALASYQKILTDAALFEAKFHRMGQTRQGGVAAREAVYALVEKHGNEAYASFEARARRELDRLSSKPSSTSEDYLRLVRAYPLADASAEAQLYAARTQADSDRPTSAIIQFRSAFQRARSPDLKSMAASELAKLYLTMDQPATARRWLRNVQRQHEQLPITLDGDTQPIEAWIAMLEGQSADRPTLPRIGRTFGQPQPIAGVPLLPINPVISLGHSGSQSFVMQHDRSLKLYDTDPSIARWQVAAEDAQHDLLSLSTEDLLLWDRQRSMLRCLATRDGKLLWPDIDAAAALDQGGVDLDLNERRAEAAGSVIKIILADNSRPLIQPGGDGVKFSGEKPDILVASSEAVIALVGKGGRVTGLNRATGEILWHARVPAEQVDLIAVSHDLLLVGGTISPGNDAESGMLAAINLITGRPRFSPLELQQPIRQFALNPDEQILAVMSDQIGCFDRYDGRAIWRQSVRINDPARNRQRVEVSEPMLVNAGRTLLLQQAGLTLDSRSGEVIARFDTQELAITDQPILGHDARFFRLTPDRLHAMDVAGQRLWSDAAEMPARSRRFAGLSEQNVAMLSVPTDPNDRGASILLILEQATGRIVAEQRLPTAYQPGPAIESFARLSTTQPQMLIRNGFILLVGKDQTWWLPTPANP
jgi:outer membrane protein assembly factor BamB